MKNMIRNTLLIAVLAGATTTARAETEITGKALVKDLKGQPVSCKVVVFIDGFDHPFKPDAPAQVRQVKKKFDPRVLVVPVGSDVEFPNQDSVSHNVFSTSPAHKFDLGIYGPGTSKTTKFARPGLVRLYCNIHPAMISDVIVVSNPFYQVVDSGDAYSLKGMPAGKYTVRAWIPAGASMVGAADLGGANRVELDFDLKQTSVSLDHSNKHGEPYPLDY